MLTVSSRDLIQTLDQHLQKRDDAFFQNFQDGLDSLVKSRAQGQSDETSYEKTDVQILQKDRDTLNESFIKIAEVTTYLAGSLRDTVKTVAELETQCQDMQNQNQSFVHRLEELHVTLMQKGQNSHDLAEELTISERQIQELTHKATELESRLASYNVLQRDYENLKNEIKDVRVNLLRKETELENLNEEFSKHQGLSSNQNSELEAKYHTIESLYEEIAELKEHNQKLNLERHQQGNLICKLQESCEEFEEAIRELRYQKKTLAETIEALQLELECAHSSQVVERHFTLDRAGTLTGNRTKRGTTVNQNSLFDELVTDEISDFNIYKRRETAILAATPHKAKIGDKSTPGSATSEEVSPESRKRRVVQLEDSPHTPININIKTPKTEDRKSTDETPLKDRIVLKSVKNLQERDDTRLMNHRRRIEEADGEVSRSMKVIIDREKEVVDQKQRIRERKQKKNFYFFGLRPMTMLNAFSEYVSHKEMETAPKE
eukprot:CAMPEP_0115046976 /NCGR_PEP_ID=MMETSP0216-20121206/49046_1 /TAXON_ID=223996 /ORGANISM="Protocruzia adherens, Strain Boccale" /LENGTH=490 /DNA_ID=CAMNT_0002430113 /DNA_START=204 /DNA_END=1676 /DNA_ORIENTATION=-